MVSRLQQGQAGRQKARSGAPAKQAVRPPSPRQAVGQERGGPGWPTFEPDIRRTPSSITRLSGSCRAERVDLSAAHAVPAGSMPGGGADETSAPGTSSSGSSSTSGRLPNPDRRVPPTRARVAQHGRPTARVMGQGLSLVTSNTSQRAPQWLSRLPSPQAPRARGAGFLHWLRGLKWSVPKRRGYELVKRVS